MKSEIAMKSSLHFSVWHLLKSTEPKKIRAVSRLMNNDQD
jgi:hypothetical protein